jgi:hypothetical protein
MLNATELEHRLGIGESSRQYQKQSHLFGELKIPY